MFNRESLKTACKSIIYQRGMQLYQQGNVKKMEVEKDPDDQLVYITGVVRGSSNAQYRVNASIQERTGRIINYGCSCPAYFQYDGMCKHCAAFLLEYINRKKDGVYLDQISTGAQGIANTMIREPFQSSRGISRVLNYYDKREKIDLIQESIKGSVELIPELTLEYGKMWAEFKIGMKKKYVLKSIPDFLRNIKGMESFQYGKDLEFFHTRECFTKPSNRMIDFLLSREDAIEPRSAYHYYRKGADARYIDIKESMLDDFMEAVGEEELSVNFSGDSAKKWTLEKEKLPLYLEIQGKKDGIELQGSFPYMAEGLKYIYLWKKGFIYQTAKEEMKELLPFLRFTNQNADNMIQIQKKELNVFSRELLPMLQEHFQVEIRDFQVEEYLPPKAEYQIYLDMPQKDVISCKLYAVYGENKYNVYAKTSGRSGRDEIGEIRMGQMVSQFFNAFDQQDYMMILSGDEEKLFLFLTEGLEKLKSLAEVYVSDAIKNIPVRSSENTTVGVSLSGDLLELEIHSEEFSNQELAEILSRYDRKKKYFRLKDGSFVVVEDTELLALADMRSSLQLSETELSHGKVLLPKYRSLYLDSQLKEEKGFSVQKDKSFRSLIRNMKTIEDNDFEIPPSLNATLREYQKHGFLWLKTLKNQGFGGILADDMGLGKTLQVIAFLLSEKEEGLQQKALIVCPASLVYNWKSEIDKFAPQLPSIMVLGTLAERKALIENSQDGDILITSYDLLKRDESIYQGIRFGYQIIDEAQYIKNHNTKASRAAKSISAGFKLALTGTPIENRLSELWSIFDYLMPGFLYTYERFREELEIPIVAEQQEAATKQLQRLIRPFILRRLKKEVLKDLPDKIEENRITRLEGEQRDFYQAHVQRIKKLLENQTEKEFASNQIGILAELTKLRQLCCDPALLYEGFQGESAKKNLCMEIIKNAMDGGHKVLLFSQFTTMLELLQEQLNKEDIPYLVLTGATSKEKRARMVDEFNQGDIPVFCISLKAGGTGLNLTAADIVIHYDPWWNIAVQNQATDRAHRIGQKQVVTVYKLIAAETIEEKIVDLQERKQDLANQVLGGEGFSISAFTKEELLSLLGDLK